MAAAYSASKAAVIALTKAVGKDVARTGVLVNCIAPAVIETPILDGLSQEHIDYMVERIPMGRVGSPRRSPPWSAGSRARNAPSRPERCTTSRAGGRCTGAPRSACAARTGSRRASSATASSSRSGAARLELARPGPAHAARALRAAAARRATGGLVRRRDLRALPRCPRRGKRRRGRLHPRLRGRPARALPEGRGVPPHGRPGRADRHRSDSAWNVPEPEVGLVLGDRDEIVGVTIGNDVSSREIEGANPLYLPQAKVYAGACALGPAVVTPLPTRRSRSGCGSSTRADAKVYAGETSTARMKRTFQDLVEYLVREIPCPPGSVLLTGTGLVPPTTSRSSRDMSSRSRSPASGSCPIPSSSQRA